MDFKKWLYPGLGIKRWISFLIVSLLLISTGISILIGYQIISQVEVMIIEFFSPVLGRFSYFMDYIIAVLLIILGVWIMNFSLKAALKGIFRRESNSKLLDELYRKKVLKKGPKIAALGGGTGLSNLLRGLKKHSSNISAIVTVADDGGSSGKLRDELGILPPGDIRNCLVALADAEPLMQELFQYRFNSGGQLEGHSFGNLFIATLTEVLGDFEEAVKESSKVLAIRGKVLPASNENVHLGAIYSDKSTRMGESVIPEANKKIEKVFLKPADCQATSEALEAIREAEIIVLGPGSLYTSIIPNLLVNGIADEILKSDAVKIYVSNVMTQPGETSDYSVADHVKAIFDHSHKGLFDYVIANKAEGSEELILKYKEEGAYQVSLDKTKLKEMGVETIEADLISAQGYIRHDPEKLAEIILNILQRVGEM
ncbi:gluconeogenesis factor YvcK family protein [Natronospora cellulosivora (SeqCode)]